MLNKWTIAAGLAVFVLAACEKEIEYKGDQGKSLLVVNAINERDSAVTVELYRSRFFLESTGGNFAISSGATLVLTDITSGQTATLTAPDPNGKYVFPFNAIAGHKFEISVAHPDYPAVTSSMTVPSPVPMLSVDTSSVLINGQSYMKGLVKWNDPAGKNFYAVQVLQWNNATGTVVGNISLASNDPAVDELTSSSEAGEYYFNECLYVADDLFDGTAKTLEIRFQKMFPEPDMHYMIVLLHCSEDAYKYMVSSRKAQETDAFFTEPVRIFNNISNGYGIFAGAARAVLIL